MLTDHGLKETLTGGQIESVRPAQILAQGSRKQTASQGEEVTKTWQMLPSRPDYNLDIKDCFRPEDLSDEHQPSSHTPCVGDSDKHELLCSDLSSRFELSEPDHSFFSFPEDRWHSTMKSHSNVITYDVQQSTTDACSLWSLTNKTQGIVLFFKASKKLWTSNILSLDHSIPLSGKKPRSLD